MPDELTISTASQKWEKYETLLPQIKALIAGSTNSIGNMANVCAALKEQFGWLWVGFYLVEGDKLVLGPFQGPVACMEIPVGKGVCGTAWQTHTHLLVPDVNTFEGHIACSTKAVSELVIPFTGGYVSGVLDIDSEHYNDFDACDVQYLKQLLEWINV